MSDAAGLVVVVTGLSGAGKSTALHALEDLGRFSSPRRPHPLSYALGPESTRAIAVLDGIRLERERLSPLRAAAKQIFDTTELSVHELRRRILDEYGPGVGRQPRMSTRVVSFG